MLFSAISLPLLLRPFCEFGYSCCGFCRRCCCCCCLDRYARAGARRDGRMIRPREYLFLSLKTHVVSITRCPAKGGAVARVFAARGHRCVDAGVDTPRSLATDRSMAMAVRGDLQRCFFVPAHIFRGVCTRGAFLWSLRIGNVLCVRPARDALE